jgi:hypothetical protein
MRTIGYLGLVAAAATLLMLGCGPERVAVGVGGPPICPYGYYEVPPYACAPDGYYGPEWFSGGVFIGAGPWYRGPARFYGHVDHAYDFRKGYRGPMPPRGAPPVRNRVPFRGQAMHDPHGHEAPAGRR